MDPRYPGIEAHVLPPQTERFPDALKQLELTMVQLQKFAEAGTPVMRDLETAAPGFTGATEALRPFAKAGTGALLSLGNAAEAAGPDLAASDDVINALRKLGESATPGNKALNKLLKTFRKTNGIKYLMDFVLNTSNAFNGFDNLGHYLRAQLQITNCVEYVITPTTGCDARFVDPSLLSSGGAPQPTKETLRGEGLPGVTDGDWNADGVVDEADQILAPDDADADGEPDQQPSFGPTSTDPDKNGTSDLLQFLTGDGQ